MGEVVMADMMFLRVMTKRARISHVLVTAMVLLCMGGSAALAQPVLSMRGVDFNWPDINVHFSVNCNSQFVGNLTRGNLQLRENGQMIQGGTVSCVDPVSGVPIEAVLVLDASGSMQGASNTLAKATAHEYARVMQTGDLTRVMYSSTVNILAPYPSVQQAIDSLPATGNYSTIWEGVYDAVTQLKQWNLHDVKAVILISDGDDVGSTRSIQEIVNRADGKVKIHTLLLADAGDRKDFEDAARLTGGKFYRVSTVQEGETAMQEIHHTLAGGSEGGCTLTYRSGCPDGNIRSAELQVSGICGGQDTRLFSILVPTDTMKFGPMPMRISSAMTMPDSTITLSLDLLRTMLGTTLQPFSLTVNYDTTCLEFLGLNSSNFTLLRDVPITVDRVPGGIRLSTNRPKTIAGVGAILEMDFLVRDVAATTRCTVDATELNFDNPCFTPTIEAGEVVVRPHGTISARLEIPQVSIDTSRLAYDPMPFTIRLEVENPGSVRADSIYATIVLPADVDVVGGVAPSQLTKPLQPLSLAAAETGSVTWEVVYDVRNRELRDSIVVLVHGVNTADVRVAGEVFIPALPTATLITALSVDGSTDLCMGDSRTLDAGDGFSEYHWSTGARGSTIMVSSEGSYFCVVVDQQNRYGVSDTIVLVTRPLPPKPQIARGVNDLSTTAAGTLQWLLDGTPIPGATGQTHTATEDGSYTVRVTNSYGCTAESDPVAVVVVSVARTAAAESFTVYPNPSDGRFRIDVQQVAPVAATVTVTDLLGRTVFTEALAPSQHIIRDVNLHQNPPGLYIIRLTAGNAQKTRIIVRE